MIRRDYRKRTSNAVAPRQAKMQAFASVLRRGVAGAPQGALQGLTAP